MTPATEMFWLTVTLSVPLPALVTVNVIWFALLGESGVGLGEFAVTETPAVKPTVTETDPMTGA